MGDGAIWEKGHRSRVRIRDVRLVSGGVKTKFVPTAGGVGTIANPGPGTVEWTMPPNLARRLGVAVGADVVIDWVEGDMHLLGGLEVERVTGADPIAVVGRGQVSEWNDVGSPPFGEE